jgi:hypothetical protein
VVDAVHERVHLRRLTATCDDDAAAALALQIAHQRPDPDARLFRQRRWLRGLHAERPGQLTRESGYGAAAERQAVVGLDAERRRRAFHRVPPGLVGARPPRLRERARLRPRARRIEQRIAVEGEHDAGLLGPQQYVGEASERGHAAGARAVVVDRLPAVPARAGPPLQQRADLRRQRRRSDPAGQHVHRRIRAECSNGGGEGPPIRSLPTLPHLPRAVRIVEPEDRRLLDRPETTAAGRMSRVAVEPPRARPVGRHQHAARPAAARHRRGELLFHDALRGPGAHGRHHAFARLPAGSAGAGERQRGGGAQQELAPALALGPLRCAGRELVR